MISIALHGRGGQGAQMAGNILANAFFSEGKQVLSFATYGGARRGTPVSSYIRVDNKPIRLRCDIETPDIIVCFDPSLLDSTLLLGATKETLLLINSTKSPEDFQDIGDFKIVTVDGQNLSQRNGLGRIVNSGLVGAVAALLKIPKLETLAQVVWDMSPRKAEQNVKCCQEGYQLIEEQKELVS